MRRIFHAWTPSFRTLDVIIETVHAIQNPFHNYRNEYYAYSQFPCVLAFERVYVYVKLRHIPEKHSYS